MYIYISIYLSIYISTDIDIDIDHPTKTPWIIPESLMFSPRPLIPLGAWPRWDLTTSYAGLRPRRGRTASRGNAMRRWWCWMWAKG